MARLPSIWEEPFGLTSRINKILGDWGDNSFTRNTFAQVDIYQKGNCLNYDLELPGLTKDDISVQVENDNLVVKGEIKRDKTINEDNYIQMNRRYGRFQRTFPLPQEITDEKNIKAKFENGILNISVPLKKNMTGKAIDVNIE